MNLQYIIKSSLLSVTLIVTQFLFARGNDVNGGWSPWGRYPSPCTKECGGGVQNFTRSCTNPVTQGQGQPCSGGSIEERPCNVDPCKTNWSDWGKCNVTCDVGVSQRHTMCGNDNCTGDQLLVQNKECVDWNINTCPSPCAKSRCPQYAKCVDISNATRPMFICSCVMGYIMNSQATACERPSPPPPVPRPIPTLSPVEKTVAVVITRTASTILLIMVGITLLIFLVLRIFTVDRIIQMNMEIALECAHLLLLFPNTLAADNPNTCRIISIGLHYLYTACFFFSFLESVHMYSIVSFVVQRNGLMSPFQNILCGWGVTAVVMLFALCFNFDQYGGEYHCWLRMDTDLVYAEFVPIAILVVLTFIMTEAAGSADYKPLQHVDHRQLFSAKISQRLNMLLSAMIFASWVLGTLSDYDQSLPLYSAFSILNAIIGFSVFFIHSLGNQEVRRKLRQCFDCCKNKLSRG